MSAAVDVDFDDAVLGQGLPPDAEAALREAGYLRGEPSAAAAALMRARALAPEHPAVLIAFYRHHFYGHRLRAARDVARQALRVGAQRLGLPAVWRDVPEQPLPGARDDAATRFYLFVLKGYAYLSLRLGDAAEARTALAKLRHLDPQDCVGAALLEAVRQRSERGHGTNDDADADADDGPALPVFGAAAWARVAGASAAGA
jgi:hypothetical protein